MSKIKEEDSRTLRIKMLKEELRFEIEKYLVEHKCSTSETLFVIPMALYDIFMSIAQTEGTSPDHVFGIFVKSFGAWDYLKVTQEG